MIKVVGIIVLALVAFFVAVITPLALTGNLNRDTMSRLMGGEEAVPTPAVEDASSQLAQDLNAREVKLEDWESELETRQTRLDQRERELDATLDQITDRQDELYAKLDELDAEHLQALQDVAKTMAAMDEKNAAADLEVMTPEDAARLLPLIKERPRGKILDEMDEEKRAKIIQLMQERKY